MPPLTLFQTPSYTSSSSSTSDTEEELLSSDTEILSDASSIPSVTPPASPQFKLHLAILRSRQSLQQQSYETLSTALSSLSSALPPSNSLDGLGRVIPILDRLGKDVVKCLSSNETSKIGRRGMGKNEAKALVQLRQKWSRVAKGKGLEGEEKLVGMGGHDGRKGKHTKDSLDWIDQVSELANKIPMPEYLTEPDAATQALLTSLEWVLLRCSTRIGLQGLKLAHDQIENWQALRSVKEVLEYYLSFEEKSGDALVAELLSSVRCLDLSKNKLDNFPSYITSLFPSIEILSLSHNQFPCLPPHICLYTNLRQLKTHSNPLHIKPSPSPRSSLAPTLPTTPKPRIPPLLHITARVLIPLLPLPIPPNYLPSHLSSLLDLGYDCQSCGSFIPPGSDHIPEIYDELLSANPGVTLPPSFVGVGGGGIQGIELDLRVILLLESRSQGDRDLKSITHVVGPTRLCLSCAWAHRKSLVLERSGLGGEEGVCVEGVKDEEKVEGGMTAKCECVMCKEAMRLQGMTEGCVLRWMRKKEIVSAGRDRIR